jgi:hypothetical protein
MKEREEPENEKALQRVTTAMVRAKPAMEIQPAGHDQYLAGARELVCAVTGTKAREVADRILAQMRAMQAWGADLPEKEKMLAAVHMFAELQPANLTEALLAVQMIGVHEAALLFLRRSGHGQTREDIDANVRRATRLLQVFQEQLTAWRN